MYIQDQLKAFGKALEREFSTHSKYTPDELFCHLDIKAVLLEGESKVRNRIQSMYVFWLRLIVEKMAENPQYRHAVTIEGIMKKKYQQVDITEIENTVDEFRMGKGLFLSTGGGTGFYYYCWYMTWSLADIAGCIKRLCEEYAKTFGALS